MSKKGFILVINCGSSSLKYEIIQFPEQESLAKGVIERIGGVSSTFSHKTLTTQKIFEDEVQIADHAAAFKIMLQIITDNNFGVIKASTDIMAVGHRVVHGGMKYAESVIIDETVIRDINELASLAPLHNPANVQGITAAMAAFSHCTHVAVFDTAFHQTIPARAYMYPLPYTIYQQYGIRKYGFHGTSHQYVTKAASELLNKDLAHTNIVSCHLGNGASITAIRKGKSINTSMGFTPLGGLMMGTRSGDIDPTIITFLLSKGHSADEIEIMLNKKSGLLGISGISNDMRDIEEAAGRDSRAVLALEMFAHRIRSYVGAYVAELNHVDMLVFTGGIGQFGIDMRIRICKPFEGLGMKIDPEKNKIVGKKSGIISTDDSPVKIAVIPTNEELQIAKDTIQLS